MRLHPTQIGPLPNRNFRFRVDRDQPVTVDGIWSENVFVGRVFGAAQFGEGCPGLSDWVFSLVSALLFEGGALGCHGILRSSECCTYPVGDTYCLGSSQILHEGRFSRVGVENCVPQVEQMRRSKGSLDGILMDIRRLTWERRKKKLKREKKGCSD